MNAGLALIRKNLIDARWMLATIGPALFGLAWFFVRVAAQMEARIKLMIGPGGPGSGGPGRGMLRGLGGSSMDFSTAAIEMAFWNTAFVLLLFAVWGIARGSGAVAGEIEKGTLDLIMSRPVARPVFLLAQVITATLGLAFLVAMMIAGNLVGSRFNTLETPATFQALLRPGLNLFAFGWAIYGYTFLLSTFDHARWRPNLIASVITLAMYVGHIIANIATLEKDYGWLDRVSIFKAYDAVEAVTQGEKLVLNAGILGVVGAVGVVAGFVVFARRDLPAGS